MDDHYTQDKLDDNARYHDEAPPQVMSLARAQALVNAHERGQLMSDELLARAYEALKVTA